mgnify:CR=1 FL=1
MSADLIFSYFPDLTEIQQKQIKMLLPLYEEWNSQINVISRKDIDKLYVNHVLHSLAIAKFISFEEGSHILDVGTGGGFPGIPLAILFPSSSFTLVDSIGKKIKVVKQVAEALELKNLRAFHQRAEEVDGKFDFVLSRAVAPASKLFSWTKDKIKRESVNTLDNGFLFLKGGDLSKEMKELNRPFSEIELSNYFSEDFFLTKKLIYIPRF